jgi:predicted nicotinamide N-methyase
VLKKSKPRQRPCHDCRRPAILRPMGRPQNSTATRARLLARIHRRYATSVHGVRFGRAILQFTRIADPDRVLDEVAAEADRRERVSGLREEGEELHLPYWAELWDSATGIGQFLAGKAEADGWMSGRGSQVPSVLDLGCGMGLSGAVAAALGARVLFADIEPPALLFARLNSLPWQTRVRTRRLNWNIQRLDETFDLIIGADILYDRTQWEHLEPFWRQHLAPGGTVLLGEPGRQTGDLFFEWIKERNWQLDLSEETVPTRKRPIRILRLRTAS